MDIALDEVLHFGAITSNTAGAAVDADSTPTWAVREEDTDAAIQTGNFTKRTALDGHYRGVVTLSAANGFDVGKWYELLGLATVDGTAGKAILKTFRVVPAENVAGVPIVDVGYVDGEAATTSLPGEELADTTIATLASQTSFTLTAGSADDDAYNGCMAVFIDQSTNTQRARCTILDYTGATKTVTLAAAPEFTIATGDTVKVVAVPKQQGAEALATNADLDALITTVGAAGAGLTAADDAILVAIAALNDFDPAADTVANVTTVATVTNPVATTSNVKKNQALASFTFLMTDSTNHEPATGLTVTCTRSIDGAAFAAGTLANVAEVANGIYKVDFGAGDLNGNTIILKATAAAADTTFERIVTQP